LKLSGEPDAEQGSSSPVDLGRWPSGRFNDRSSEPLSKWFQPACRSEVEAA
jgi:hypothetical protein